MGLTDWFGFNKDNQGTDLPNIFPLGMNRIDFIRIDVISIYTKILTDVIERTHGLKEEFETLMWDNCLQSESNYGLITRLAIGMTDKSDIFLVYDPAINLLRLATADEQAKIRVDYKKSGESSIGIFISFSQYNRTDMVRLYSALEYCTIGGLNKAMNLSNAIQFKISDLRPTTSFTDSIEIKKQALLAAQGLGAGKDVLIDAKDIIETSKPDLTSTQASIDFLNQKRAFYLGLPYSYICGEQTGGLGSTGEGDTKAVERGLKNYYSSIVKPVLESLFDASVTYKSQDFRQIDSAMNAMKTFALTDESLVTIDNKKRIIEGLLDIDPDDNKDTTQPESLQGNA